MRFLCLLLPLAIPLCDWDIGNPKEVIMIETITKSHELSFLRALVFGDSGIGKTTSLGTLPEASTCIVSVERSLLPLRGKDYPVLRIGGMKDLREIPKRFKDPPEIGGKQIDTLAVDSLSEISEICKREIVTVDRKQLIGERTSGRSSKPKGVYDDLLTMEDWGLYASRMKGLVSTFCHLPVHVIFTCLAKWGEDKQTGAQNRTPDINGSFATSVPAYFDFVFHMEAVKGPDGEDRRVWRTTHDGRILAKDSTGILDQFEEANWAKLFNKFLNNNEEKNHDNIG